MRTLTITAYVDTWGDLVTYDTAEPIRRATASERADSAWARQHEGRTGAITVTVSSRTVRQRCRMYRRQYLDAALTR